MDQCKDAPSELSDHGPIRSPLGHRLMFLTLTCLAFCLFAPTTVLPILREYGQLLAEEAQLKRQTTELRREIERQDALLVAFASDRTINERLAVLDLNYRNPNEQVLPILPPGYSAPTPKAADKPLYQSDLLIPQQWPKGVRRIERWANDRGLIDLFLNPNLRPVLLLMSGGLVIAAFVLFAPRRRREKSEHLAATRQVA